jgi:hypothetical protein
LKFRSKIEVSLESWAIAALESSTIAEELRVLWVIDYPKDVMYHVVLTSIQVTLVSSAEYEAKEYDAEVV